MSEKTNPMSYPEKAAFELVIELIRAERVPMHSDDVSGLLKIYDQAANHFRNAKSNRSEG